MATPKFTPVVIDTPSADEPVEMVDLFVLNGVAYQIPAEPRMNLAMQLIVDMEKHGDGVANMMLLRKLLGAGYDALAAADGLKPEQLGAVAQAASNFTLGALEEDPSSGN